MARDNDIQCQDAVIRRLEILGEAARRVSEQTRAKFPHLPPLIAALERIVPPEK